jgi:hypothetical protein
MKVVIVSYVSGHAGSVTSEWVDDKLRVLEMWRKPVTLVTGPRSRILSTSLLKVRRAFSLGWIDFSSEFAQAFQKSRWSLLIPVSFSLGKLFDWLFIKLAGSYSHGFWSWIPIGVLETVRAVLQDKDRVILTTGGPSSAHFIGLLTKFLVPKTKLFVEFQDPFIGTEMALSRRALKTMVWLEHLLIHHATKVVFVTKAAAERAAARHNDCPRISSIQFVYPGSWNYGIKRPVIGRMSTGPTFLHMGTLYSNRNLDNFFVAIDRVIENRPEIKEEVMVINLGNLAVANSHEYHQREYFLERPLVPRLDALREAVKADFLLLVQHVDSRSEETIPYKTYDYLNLNIPIFALTNNQELEDLILKNGGYVAKSDSVESIENALDIAIRDYKSQASPKSNVGNLVIEKQVSELLT